MPSFKQHGDSTFTLNISERHGARQCCTDEMFGIPNARAPLVTAGLFLNFNSEFEGLSVGKFVVLTAAVPGRCSPVTGAPPLEEPRCAARGFPCRRWWNA